VSYEEAGDMTAVSPRPVRWLDERLDAIRFRLRLLRMAFRPVDRIPALLIMALESSDPEAGELLDPDPLAAEFRSVR
jgi:hypothetical protein